MRFGTDMNIKTIREQSEATLIHAVVVGRITEEERRSVTTLWTETNRYKRDPRAKALPDYFEREQEASAIFSRAAR
jgi:hypothetical protein